MSKETSHWLNNYCLVGFTDKRGNAWHYRASDQGAEPNHYPGAIPLDDVIRRLFDWEAVERPVYYEGANGFVQAADRKAIVASDNDDLLGIFKDGYVPHQYKEWLIDNVASILDTSSAGQELGIGSALLLRNRGVAVVQVEVPESLKTPEGVEYRPNLLAATSFDGSLATTYKRTITVAVCDNTTEQGLAEAGQQYKLKHRRNSSVRLGEARDALQIIFDSGKEFEEELSKLCNTRVTEKQWTKVLDALVPFPEQEGNAYTRAEKKRSALDNLWRHDERVEPWSNTAWGVAQAFNTYAQHIATVKKAHRAERNFDNVLSGKVAASDLQVLTTLEDVIGKQLVGV